jgi:hypothetical protein
VHSARDHIAAASIWPGRGSQGASGAQRQRPKKKPRLPGGAVGASSAGSKRAVPCKGPPVFRLSQPDAADQAG